MSYKYTKNDDGTFNILNVEIFDECERVYDPNADIPMHGYGSTPWEPPNPPLPIERMVFDATWINSVVADFHANSDVRRIPIFVQGGVIAGYVENLRVAGKRLFGDLNMLTRQTFELIKEGRLPCSACEIADAKIPRITALMLLSESYSFFKFPNLIVE